MAAGGTLGILLPPSIVLILYAVAAEQSLGRLFLAGIGPGVLLVGLFATYAVLRWKQEFGRAEWFAAGGGARSEILRQDTFTLRRQVQLPAAGAAVPGAADRGDGGAVWRDRDAERDGGAGRGDGAGC